MNSQEGRKKAVSYESMTRPSGKEAPLKPDITFLPDSSVEITRSRSGAEGLVYEALLEYKDVPKKGFVYKRLHGLTGGYEDLSPEMMEEILTDTLGQWNKIRAVRQTLKQESKPGFNIPGTIRGVRGEGEYGLLLSDLSEGGKKQVIDLKMLRARPDIISPAQWQEIKKAVLNDLDIASLYGIKVVSGLAGLDAWLVSIDKETGECKVYLSDIGMYSSEQFDAYAKENPTRNDPEFLSQLARSSIDNLEKALKVGWEEEAKSVPLKNGEVKQDLWRFRFFRP
jgi:hypothetical protein